MKFCVPSIARRRDALRSAHEWAIQVPFPSTLLPSVLSYYGYDGHGSVRFLMDTGGGMTDSYTYDAFGNLIASNGSTPNNFLYSAQQWDSDLGLYYNRARYLNPGIGRFWTMDGDYGNNEDPLSLHKYLYAEDDPVDGSDPIGLFSYLFFDPNGGPAFDEGAGHVGVGVDSGTNVLRRDAAWDSVGPLGVFKSEQEARFGATIVVVFPNQKLANGGMSDDAIASFVRSGESDLGIIYCSDYSAEALRAGGYDLGYWAGITPTGLLEDAEEVPGVRVDLFGDSVMTVHSTVSASAPPTGTINVNTPTIFLDFSATVDSVQF